MALALDSKPLGLLRFLSVWYILGRLEPLFQYLVR